MENGEPDMNRALMVDGNAAAGILYDVFALEMTAAPTACAACGNQAEVGALLAFMKAPGLVLRCPTCESTMLRIVETPQAIYLDARGAAYLRLRRRG